jgi:hypothetical protein
MVLLAAIMDTKGDELRYLSRCLHGAHPLLKEKRGRGNEELRMFLS